MPDRRGDGRSAFWKIDFEDVIRGDSDFDSHRVCEGRRFREADGRRDGERPHDGAEMAGLNQVAIDFDFLRRR